jgi:hypothetical protein
VLGTFADPGRCLILASLFGALALSPAAATTPDRSWLGIKRLAIVTEVQQSLRPSPLTNDLCARVKRIAERDAPIPVECAQLGDAALQKGDTVVLIAQASLQEIGRERALLFTARKDKEGGLDPQPVLLGSAPRAVPLTGSAADEAALDRALGASLSEILSWLRPAEVEQQILEISPNKRERF